MRCLMFMAFAAAFAAPSSAQQSSSYSGEVVVTSAGTLASPWKTGSACTGPNDCKAIIYNEKTGEIAKFGEQWSTSFVSSGREKEVWRAETASAKALRLKTAQ